MSVQFQCAGCQQPIEVDAEWAGKLVACPYCRRTITAPPHSTLSGSVAAPMASPLAPPASLVPDSGRPARPPRNPLAVTSLVLACLMFGFLVSIGLVTQAYPSEAAELERRFREGGSAAMFEYWREQGGRLPGWMVAVGLLEMGGVLCGLAAIICALVALRTPTRRGPAIAALVACGSVLMLFLMGTLAALATIGSRA